MYECESGEYSFSLDKDVLKREEANGLGNAIITGMMTGYFDVLAHPDRIFRKCEVLNLNMEKMSKDIINVAIENKVILEKNISSMNKNNQYRNEFWELVPKYAKVITGLDAHSVAELKIVN